MSEQLNSSVSQIFPEPYPLEHLNRFKKAMSDQMSSRSGSASKHFHDRLVPEKINSQTFHMTCLEQESPKPQGIVPHSTSSSQDLDLNEQLRVESSFVKYSNLLKLNILENQSYNYEELHQQNDDKIENKTMSYFNRSKSRENSVLVYSKNKNMKQTRYKPYVFSQQVAPPPKQPIRKISKNPFKILDAPKLKDDFYYSLLDWSHGNQIAIGLENAVYTWNANTNEASKLVELMSPQQISAVSWCNRGEILAVGDDCGTLRIYDVEKSKQIRQYDNHLERIGTLDWNGCMITSGSRDKSIYLCDIRQQKDYSIQFHSHKQEVCGLKWSPSETMLASGGNDNQVVVQSFKMPQSPLYTFRDHTAAVKALAWSPHQQNLLCTGGGTTDKSLKFWNVGNGTLLQSIDTGSQICNMKWSINTDELVTSHGFSLNQIAVWQMGKVQRIATLYGHTFRVLYMAISPDGENIVTGSGDETLRFWKIFPPQKQTSVIRNASVLDPHQFELR